MLTAKSQEAEKVLGLEIGADDYVTKPYSPRELRARVKAVLRRTEDDDLTLYRFGDMELDFERCELRRAGKRIELTALDFKLLTTFACNRGRVLTRDRLLDLVWDPSRLSPTVWLTTTSLHCARRSSRKIQSRGISSASGAWDTVLMVKQHTILTITRILD